jgi:hypothetical protein
MKTSFRLSIFLAALMVAIPCFGQAPQRQFERAEKLLYEAEFSRALLRNLDVADFRFSAERVPLVDTKKDAETSGKNYSLEFTGEVKSKGFFAKLFNLNFLQRVTSTVEPGSFSVQRTKRFDQQGKRVRESETVYDRDTGTVVWTEHDLRDPSREPRIFSSPFSGQVQDVLSAIYFLRTQRLETGKSFQLKVTDSGQVYEVPVRVTEKKRMKTVLGKVDAFRVDVDMFGAQRLIQSDGQFTIWMTADQQHVPVKARIKSDYGTFNITLKKVLNNSSIAQAK